MRLGKVVGRVTFNQVVPPYHGGRFLVVSPFSRAHMQQGDLPPAGMSGEPTLIVYDALGAGTGDSVGFVEGREAAVPFPTATPVDAMTAIIVDHVVYRPKP